MKQEIRDKLDRIHTLYPPERIEASKARWRWLWHGGERPDRLPFFYNTFMPRYYGTIYDTTEQLLHARLDEYIIRGQLGDDYIPAIFTGCKTSTIPTMFGAREFQIDFAFDCDPVLESIEDVPKLITPTLEGSTAERWLNTLRELRDLTEGELPIHVIDMQGPADVCGKLLGYEQMLMGAYNAPDLFHELMRKVTDVFVMLWEAQKEILGDLFVPTHLNAQSWVPNEPRASVSIDSLDMIGPDFYDEFFRPHIVALGERLGDLTIHSCGDPSPVLKSVAETPHVCGINAAQLSIKQAAEALDGADCVIVGAAKLSGDIEDTTTFIRQRDLRCDLKVNGIWPKHADGTVIPPEDWSGSSWDEHRRVLKLLS